MEPEVRVMNGHRLTPALVLALAGALVLFSGAAGSATGTKTKQASGPIRALAMDGSRVAYDVANPRILNGPGNKVLVWNVLTGKVTKVSGHRTYAADTTSTGSGVRELAIAGKRVTWIINQGGNSESDDYLCASSVTRPKELKLAEATRSGPYPSSPGDWISGLVGSAGTLAVNRWHADEQGTVTEARLVLIGTWGMKRIALGEQTLVAQSTDGARIAVLRSDGTVGIYSTAGRLLLNVKPSATKKIALHGKYLVALTTGRKLEVYESHTGSLVKTLPVRGRVKAVPQNLDVESNLAVYTVWPDVRVVNLKTGKDRVIGHMRAFYFYNRVFAQIEPAGVVYAGNVRNRPVKWSTTGTIVFVPFARVAAAVS
jgi:hypothetical protein